MSNVLQTELPDNGFQLNDQDAQQFVILIIVTKLQRA